MDRAYIDTNHLVDRYVQGKLSGTELDEFEIYMLEHPKVVEIGLELMIERWLIRQHSDFWRSGRREHDIVLWAKGARR